MTIPIQPLPFPPPVRFLQDPINPPSSANLTDFAGFGVETLLRLPRNVRSSLDTGRPIEIRSLGLGSTVLLDFAVDTPSYFTPGFQDSPPSEYYPWDFVGPLPPGALRVVWRPAMS